MATPQRLRAEEELASPPTGRVVRVLELFARTPLHPMGLAEVARALGLNKATVHLILNTLVQLEWLSRDESTKLYSVGAGFAAAGLAAENALPAVTLASTELTELAARHDYGMALLGLIADELRVLKVVLPPSFPDRTLQVGLTVPFAPPLGTVFAAWAPPSRRKEWLDRAPAETKEVHEAALERVLERGYAIELMNETSELRRSIAQLRTTEEGREAQRLLYRLMAQLSTAGEAEVLPGGQKPVLLDDISVPVLDEFGHARLMITAHIAGGISRSGLARLAADLRGAAQRVATGISDRTGAPAFA